MLARCRRLSERWGVALALALVLSLFVRLTAPYAGAADRDGYIAICSGSEIVYLPVSLTDGPPPDDTGTDKPQLSPLHLPCNWLGQYVALLPALQALVLPADRAPPPELATRTDVPRPKQLKPFQSQAPPSGRNPLP